MIVGSKRTYFLGRLEVGKDVHFPILHVYAFYRLDQLQEVTQLLDTALDDVRLQPRAFAQVRCPYTCCQNFTASQLQEVWLFPPVVSTHTEAKNRCTNAARTTASPPEEILPFTPSALPAM